MIFSNLTEAKLHRADSSLACTAVAELVSDGSGAPVSLSRH